MIIKITTKYQDGIEHSERLQFPDASPIVQLLKAPLIKKLTMDLLNGSTREYEEHQ